MFDRVLKTPLFLYIFISLKFQEMGSRILHKSVYLQKAVHFHEDYRPEHYWKYARSFKVVRLVDLKLAFTDWFFYNLIILTKLCKIQHLNLDKALLFPRNRLFVWKTLTSSNYHKVYYFLLKFCTRFLFINVYKTEFGIFYILFKSWVINKNVNKI